MSDELLDIERLARALHAAQPHWNRHRTTFEQHREGHLDEARAIAAAYAATPSLVVMGNSCGKGSQRHLCRVLDVP